MTKRPYFNSKIEELEKLFESSKTDRTVLVNLLNELHFRKTTRAKKLNEKIQETLKEKSGDSKFIIEMHQASLTKNREVNTIDEVVAKNKEINIICSEVPRVSSEKINEISNNNREQDEIPIVINNGTAKNSKEEAIISAWLTQEILTPQPLPSADELRASNRRLISLKEICEPWKDACFNKCGKETGVFWMIYLGELDLAKAMKSIIRIFPDETADEKITISGNTTTAVIVVDAYGKLVPNKVFLSSFAWGYGKVRAGKINELASFVEVEQRIREEIEKRLIKADEEGESQPVTFFELNEITEWLVQELNLPQNEVNRFGSAIRVPQYSHYSEEPEPELLNSFFIEDLVRVRDQFFKGNIGSALFSYLHGQSDILKQDIIHDKELLAETLAPEKFPLARWPGKGRHPLYLMQQAAINHAVSELKNEGLVAVNGPPGTGKTTLLRDIVAKVVLDRAIAMAQFEKPEMAFKYTGKMKTGRAFTSLYQLDDSLLGHEIVVASSNNKAVENISREIPSLGAIADDFESPVRYFQTISDAIASGEKEFASGSTWGLSAAVLGNAANRFAFIKSFWWDEQRGMSQYLNAIIGTRISDSETALSEVVKKEKPPQSEFEALERWSVVRKNFLDKVKKVEALRCKAQEYYLSSLRKDEVEKLIILLGERLCIEKNDLISEEKRLGVVMASHEKLLSVEEKVVNERKFISQMRPGFFSRLFHTQTYKEWRCRMSAITDEIGNTRSELQKVIETKNSTQELCSQRKEKVFVLEEEKNMVEKENEKLLALISEGKERIGYNFADKFFWLQDDSDLQTSSPWIFSELQEARDELFVASFELHRSFIDGAAKVIRHNLRGALELLRGRNLSANQELARRSLWASLFMVVPVLSTTFASTSRLFGKLGKEHLGWLLIDEAGQVVPQAALGALWRAKRAIVIGDPLQIEPVVPLPEKLINVICSCFSIGKDEWMAPDVSAQILADKASWLGTNISSEDGDIWVGSPLRVHRRCQQPMFNISNYIAYNGIMVSKTPNEQSSVGEILGKSTWINVKSDNISGKWSRDEGEIAVQMLEKLFDAGIEEPEIFFITPFRAVASELRQMIRKNNKISNKLLPSAWEWTNKHIGTVHTFQGREADTVVFILGAPLDESKGARHWAGKEPNLLNVAVTRAKRRLYVIGNLKAWENVGYFHFLATSLPTKKV